MSRVSRRLKQLERRLNVDQPPVGRLFVLIPELWPEQDREAFFNLQRREPLEDLVERRTGVRPIWDPHRIWAIVYRLPEDAHAWDAATKVAFLAAHETRPLAPWQRGEPSCG